MKFIAWAVICFIAATDWAGNFCRSRLDELLLLLQLNAHSALSHDSTSYLAQKGLHVFLYAMLGYFAASERDTRRRKLENAAGATICILTEIFQYFTRTRHMSPYDMALNLTAFTLAATWCMYSRRPAATPESL